MSQELVLDIEKKCGENGSTCNCEKRPEDITASKDTNTPVNGFTKYVHWVTSGKSFTLNGKVDGSKVGSAGKSIDNVTSVSVYYWNGAKDNPILLGITINGKKPTYYGRSSKGNPWMNGWVKDLNEQRALDNQNCYNNNAVVFNIHNPELGTLNENSKVSNCIKKNNKITAIDQPSASPPGSDYTIKTYNISAGTKISRVTYGGRNTDITLKKGNGIDKVRVYFSAGSIEVPLIVEFIPQGSGESKWHYTHNADGRNWTGVDGNKSKTFYDGQGQPTEALYNELDSIACSIDIGVTLDLTKSNSEQLSKNSASGRNYCCDGYHSVTNDKKVTVTRGDIKAGNPSPITFYKHTISGGKLAAIKYNKNKTDTQRKGIKFTSPHFPISNVQSVYVFYCSEEKPVLMYVDSDSMAKGWYQKGNHDDESWTWIPGGISNVKPTDIVEGNLDCDKWKRLSKVLKNRSYTTLKECTDKSARLHSQGVELDETKELMERNLALKKEADEKSEKLKQEAERIANDEDDPPPKQLPVVPALSPDGGNSADGSSGSSGSNGGVIIKLGVKPKDNEQIPKEYRGTTTGTGKLIKVTRYEDPPNFYRYTHVDKDSHGVSSFRLKDIQDENGNIGITQESKDGKDVTSVSAYYWRHEKPSGGNPSKALLVEVVQNDSATGNKHSYYAKITSGWAKYSTNSSENGLSRDELTYKLNLLNCEINDVVQIDASQTGGPYCHKFDRGHTKKISVEPDGSVNILGFGAHKHYIKDSSGLSRKFNISEFNWHFPISGLTKYLPFKNVDKVIVFYRQCSQGKYERPIVIYVDHNDGGKRKWYQRKDSQEVHNNTWIEILNMDNVPYDHNNIENIRKQLIDIATNLGEPLCPQPILDFTIEKANHFQHADSEDPGEDVDVIGNVEFSDYRATYPVSPVNFLGYSVPPYEFDVEEFDVVVCDRDTQDHKVTIDYNMTNNGDEFTTDVPNTRDYVKLIDFEPTLEPTAPLFYDRQLEVYGSNTTGTNEGNNPVSVDFYSYPQTALGIGTPSASVPPTILNLYTAPSVQEPPDQPQGTPPEPEGKKSAFASIVPATIAGYVVPSVFGGSAATFFGGWKLYNRYKGDPWVRQI